MTQNGEHSGKAKAEGSGLCLHLKEHCLPIQRCQFYYFHHFSINQHYHLWPTCEDRFGLLHRADVEVPQWQDGARGDDNDDSHDNYND